MTSPITPDMIDFDKETLRKLSFAVNVFSMPKGGFSDEFGWADAFRNAYENPETRITLDDYISLPPPLRTLKNEHILVMYGTKVPSDIDAIKRMVIDKLFKMRDNTYQKCAGSTTSDGTCEWEQLQIDDEMDKQIEWKTDKIWSFVLPLNYMLCCICNEQVDNVKTVFNGHSPCGDDSSRHEFIQWLECQFAYQPEDQVLLDQQYKQIMCLLFTKLHSTGVKMSLDPNVTDGCEIRGVMNTSWCETPTLAWQISRMCDLMTEFGCGFTLAVALKWFDDELTYLTDSGLKLATLIVNEHNDGECKEALARYMKPGKNGKVKIDRFLSLVKVTNLGDPLRRMWCDKWLQNHPNRNKPVEHEYTCATHSLSDVELSESEIIAETGECRKATENMVYNPNNVASISNFQ